VPKFNFVVKDPAGKTIQGTITMDRKDQLIERLRDQGYYISRITEVNENSIYQRLDRAVQRLSPVKLKDISVFARLLSTMINAGLPILRALRIIEKQTENLTLVDSIKDIASKVEEGYSLSYAMSQHPKIFGPLIVAMIKSGEESGSLDIVLERIAHDLEREIEIRTNVQAGVRYPVIIMIAAAIIVAGVLIWIVPKFKQIFEEMGADLPLMTRLLVAVSDAIVGYFFWVVGALIVLVIFIKQASKVPFFGRIINKVQLKLPAFGTLFRKIALSRFSRTLAILLRSGVPIVKALTVVEETVGNFVIAGAVSKAKESIKEGERIAYPLEETNEFPPMVIDMISVGEETGSLDDMLQKVSEFYDREVDYTIDSFTTMIEPVLIVTMGVIIGFIVISLYLPLFGAIRKLSEAGVEGTPS
jgi:type IV pilus assembly protein PilC